MRFGDTHTWLRVSLSGCVLIINKLPFKGKKVVATTDRYGNVLSPYTTAPGNKNESPLFIQALTHLKSMMKQKRS